MQNLIRERAQNLQFRGATELFSTRRKQCMRFRRFCAIAPDAGGQFWLRVESLLWIRAKNVFKIWPRFESCDYMMVDTASEDWDYKENLKPSCRADSLSCFLLFLFLCLKFVLYTLHTSSIIDFEFSSSSSDLTPIPERRVIVYPVPAKYTAIRYAWPQSESRSSLWGTCRGRVMVLVCASDCWWLAYVCRDDQHARMWLD